MFERLAMATLTIQCRST